MVDHVKHSLSTEKYLSYSSNTPIQFIPVYLVVSAMRSQNAVDQSG